jgi:hypothetical protein
MAGIYSHDVSYVGRLILAASRLILAAISGVAALTLALQGAAAWHPTETEGAAVVAIAATCTAITILWSSIRRYEEDVRWRRNGALVYALGISFGAVFAAAALALFAAGAWHVIRPI